MPAKRVSMRKIKEVLRLRFEVGLSARQIAHSCVMGRTTVREYLQRAERAGLAWPLPEEMTERELEALMFPAPPPGGAARPLPDWQQVHEELKSRGVALFVLWEEYKAGHPDGFQYSRFCDLYRAWKGKLPVWMRQEHKAGEKVFVDYAGMTMPVRDRKTGAVRQAQIFVATMGASYYTYAEATWTQTLPDFISSHVRAFAYFGGASELLVPDNLRSAVSRSCRYEPDANPTYSRLAQHYGAAILPARPVKPCDKSRVESSVGGVERRILAKLRHQSFFSLEDLNRAIWGLLEAYNDRPFQQLEGTRRSVFEKLEKPALKPLPPRPFEYEEWAPRRVNLDYHVRVRADEHNYSVPHRLVGEKIDVRLTVDAVECFHKGERVATHVRAHKKNGYSTLPQHMPERHREHAKWTPERIVHWASKAGPHAAQVAERIIASRAHPQQGYQACRGLIRLGEAYGSERLDAACERALAINSASYKTVAEILKQGLDKLPLPKPRKPSPAIAHDNVRGADYLPTQARGRRCLCRSNPKGATLMLTNPTLDKLQRLRLLGMYDAYREQLESSRYDALGFDERFALLLDRQEAEQDTRRLQARLNKAKLRQNACVEDIDYRTARGLNKTQVHALAECHWLRSRENCIITGPTGAGKSYLACAFGNQACRRGFTVRYFRAPRFFQELAVARGAGRYDRVLRSLLRTELLIIDDWGTNKRI